MALFEHPKRPQELEPCFRCKTKVAGFGDLLRDEDGKRKMYKYCGKCREYVEHE